MSATISVNAIDEEARERIAHETARLDGLVARIEALAERVSQVAKKGAAVHEAEVAEWARIAQRTSALERFTGINTAQQSRVPAFLHDHVAAERDELKERVAKAIADLQGFSKDPYSQIDRVRRLLSGLGR